MPTACRNRGVYDADEIELDFDEHVANMVRFLTEVAPQVGL
jgi:hypothetical protein